MLFARMSRRPILSNEVGEGGQTVTLVQNTFDQYGSGLTSTVNAFEHDSGYSQSMTTRGNVTTSVSGAKTTNTTYDYTGTATGANDGNGHAVTISSSAVTNSSAPDSIQPSTGSGNDSKFATGYV